MFKIKIMKKILYVFIIILVSASCKKNKDDVVQIPPAAKSVYMVGFEHNATTNKDVAKMWKSNIATTLTDSTVYTTANKNLVNGNDIYALCSIYAGSNTYNAKLWKNGVLIDLPNNNKTAFANSIAIAGTDIYVGGCGQNSNNSFNKAIVWKNNVPKTIAGSDSTNACIYAVASNGTDIYYAGIADTFNGSVTRLWKNEVPIILGNTYKSNSFVSLAVNGNDVAVAYNTQSMYANYVGQGHIWKNGTVINFENNATTVTQVNKMVMQTNDMYALLTEKNIATGVEIYKIWKNGTTTILQTAGSGGEANEIFIDSTDIYVVGTEIDANGKRRAMMWKNGIVSYITNGVQESEGLSIFVK
jgi:hypothetical protein